MGEGSSKPGPTPPAGANDGEPTQIRSESATRSRLADVANLESRPPTEVVPPRPPTEVVPPPPATDVVPPRHAQVVRYGPGVPASVRADQADLMAGQVWRTGHTPAPARRRRSLRRLVSSALTVILLAASGVVLFLRFYHASFHVTGVVISQRTLPGCGVDVIARISTNGSAGTVTYQWLFRPGGQRDGPLSLPVADGQHAGYVTVPVEGSGHGSASQTVTLQVLRPDLRTTSTAVLLTC